MAAAYAEPIISLVAKDPSTLWSTRREKLGANPTAADLHQFVLRHIADALCLHEHLDGLPPPVGDFLTTSHTKTVLHS